LTSKIHVLSNEAGRIIKFNVTKGSVNDCTQTEMLFDFVLHKGVYVLGDKAYDTDKIIDYINEESAFAVIPSRKNRRIIREYDKEIYKNRSQAERFFNKLKNFRRISTRYDKLVSSFISFVQLAFVLIIIPKFLYIV